MASSSRDLRVVLGHRAAAKRFDQVIHVQEDPVSPPGILVLDEEAMAAAAAQGRRRSSLNADTTFLEQVHTAEESPRGHGVEEGESTMAPLVCTGSQSSITSLAGEVCPPGEPALPSYLQEEKERVGRLREEANASESPSPSQRAALDAMYDDEGAKAAAQGLSSGLAEADTEAEAEVEADAAMPGVMDHLVAGKLISERPELQRWDSADAELEMVRRKQNKAGVASGSGSSDDRRAAAEPLLSQLHSELHHLSDDQGGGSGALSQRPVPANALEHPPQTHAKRRGSGLVELADAEEEAAQVTAGQEDQEQQGPLEWLRPLLAHFDSGDYFKQKEEGKARPSAPEAIKPEEQGQQEGGHKAVASFILHQGHNRIGH